LTNDDPGIQYESKRIGEIDDIGHAAVWLASDAADYVTGISLYIDGGMTLYPGLATGG
jgi:glucose 1-dehydrogenase